MFQLVGINANVAVPLCVCEPKKYSIEQQQQKLLSNFIFLHTISYNHKTIKYLGIKYLL